jgi:hypothetical protein
MSSPSVSAIYRTLLRLAAHATPVERSRWASIQVRDRFDRLRQMADRPSAEVEAEWRREADEAIKFLKIVAGVRPIVGAGAPAVGQSGVVRIAIDPLSGKVLQNSAISNEKSDSRILTNARSIGSHVVRDQRVTGEQMERHHRLLRRQHFLDRK